MDVVSRKKAERGESGGRRELHVPTRVYRICDDDDDDEEAGENISWMSFVATMVRYARGGREKVHDDDDVVVVPSLDSYT